MQNVSDNHKRVVADARHYWSVYVTIAGERYNTDEIVSLRTYGGIFENFSVGNAPSRQIELTILPVKEHPIIPKMAEIRVYTQPHYDEDGVTYSGDVISKGVFFVDTRRIDKVTSAISFTGYDAMLKSSATWGGKVGIKQKAAVEAIAERMSVEIDERTEMNANYTVVNDKSDYSCNDLLCQVAACNGGNFVITDEGKLLLVRIFDIPSGTNYLIDDIGNVITFGEVKIVVG